MTVYWLLLTGCVGLAVPLCLYKPTALKKEIYLGLMLLTLATLSAVRYSIGAAYTSYVYIFDAVERVKPGDFWTTSWERQLGGYTVEYSLLLLMRLCGLLGMNARGFLAVAAFICLAPVWVLTRQKSPMPWLSVWLYVTLLCFAGTMDAVRQCMAAGMMMLGYPWLTRKGRRYTLYYALLTVAASLVHQTALVMLLPMVFTKLKWRKTALILWCVCGAAFCCFGRQLVESVLTRLLPALGMGERFGYYTNSTFLQGSMNMHMISAAAVIMALYITLYRRVKERYPDDALPLFYLLSFTLFAWLSGAQMRIMIRLILYTMPYAIIALPMAVSSLAPERREGVTLSSLFGRGNIPQCAALCLILVGTMLYFCFNGQTGGTYHGYRGMYLCVPYTSYLPWLNIR